jgi:hypothetical protein
VRARPQLAWLTALAYAWFSFSNARPAHAAETPDERDKALPCRPTIACTADLVPPGTLDVETGALFRQLGDAASSATRATGPDQSDASPVSSRDGGFLFAFTHSPRPWLIFDIGGDIGWFPSTRSYSLFIGMSFIPLVLWRDACARCARREEQVRVRDPAWKERPLPASSAIR